MKNVEAKAVELSDIDLKYILPDAGNKSIQLYLPLLNRHMPRYDINTPLRAAAFLAQLGHESGSLRYVREIASGEAYEGRRDLGNTAKGDGVKYRGRGLIQITGKSNYRSCGEALRVDFINYPELLETPEYAVESACWFWGWKGLNAPADAGDFLKITKTINGGYNGLTDRQEIYARAKKLFGI
jgi:putative chitinase